MAIVKISNLISLFFYIFSVSSQTKFVCLFFFFNYYLFIIYLFYFKSRMTLFIWGFGLRAAGIPSLDFRKNTKKKSSAKKLYRTDSSLTAYYWFSILSLLYIYIYIYIYICTYSLAYSSYWTRNCSDFKSKIEV